MSDTNLRVFKAIAVYINELTESFGSDLRPLKLFNHFIGKVSITHEKIIARIIGCFKEFCVANQEQIMAKNCDLTDPVIKYSDKVFIDMQQVFSLADNDSKKVIWAHLLHISAYVNPSHQAKELLRRNMEEQGANGAETEFLTNIISKVGEQVTDVDNPMQAIGAVMSSGIFTELMSGMNEGVGNGSFDLGNLLGAVQGMVQSLGDQLPPGGGQGGGGGGPNPNELINTLLQTAPGGANLGAALPSPASVPVVEEVEEQIEHEE